MHLDDSNQFAPFRALLGIKEGRPEAADGPEAYPLRPENPAAFRDKRKC